MAGYDIHPYYGESSDYPVDFMPVHRQILDKVRPYTLAPPERTYALIEAIGYIVREKVPGSLVECGVWRGGSMMAAALALRDAGCSDRDIYLFDTFEGMPKPEDVDVDYEGAPAMDTFTQQRTGDDSSGSCYASLADVRTTMRLSGHDERRIHFIQGKVEDTIPDKAPESIALLRLDTDWYSSTKHELIHLYPRLARGGVVIIDDYGHWQGARKAMDEYMAAQAPSLFLNRVDYSARLAIKP
jgi:predicted O-methyltransferase YrrM